MADSLHSKVKSKDMYWFAHGGEPLPDKSLQQRSDGDEDMGSPEQHNSPSWKPLQERKVLPEETRGAPMGKECAASVMADGTDNSPLLSSVERDDRVAAVPDSYSSDAAVCGNTVRAAKNAYMGDEKSKKNPEAEQDKNDVKTKKKMERDAALEARRNAQRSNVSFAFGSSLPRNLDLDVTTVYQGSDLDKSKKRSSQAPASLQRPADDKMSQSMISPMSACRGRRKTDLTPTIPYDRMAPPRTPVPSASSGKRSVSMTRLDQLARPRRSYVEAQRDHAKANGTSSNSSVQKEMQSSPSRPRSSASEHSVSSNRPATTPPVNMRARTTARKPRPVSIAGTMPDRKSNIEFKKDLGTHRTPEKKKEVSTTKKAPAVNKPKSPASKNISAEKPGQKTPIKHLTPKSSPIRKPSSKSRKSAPPAASAPAEAVNTSVEETSKVPSDPSESPTAATDEESSTNIPESAGKRIISEEEARAALAEKRRLAREQAEREAELERQRQEELRQQEEERIRKEEEEQRKMEEEQLRLLEEHKRQEEEKLRKAIEEQERKEQEEKLKREEEARLKAEQDRKAKEEAERQRIELEEKLRKEEEERAERKKRLEKIMSRTRGRSAASSHSGGDQSDSADSQAGEPAEVLSGNSSLNSIQSTDPSSGSASLEIQQAESIQGSEHESLNSMEMIVLSENSSLDSNLLMLPSDGPVSLDSDQASILSSQNFPCDEKVVSVDPSVGFGASGDNRSSCSSENETVHTDTTVVLSDEKKTYDYPSVASESEDKLDSASGQLLDFDKDTVQTLVSESGDDVCPDRVNFPSSDQSAVENSGTDTTSDPTPVSSEHFTIGKKQDLDAEPTFDSFTKSCEEIGATEGEKYVEKNSVAVEMAVGDVPCSKDSEVHEAQESTIDSGNLKGLEIEQNVDSTELKTSPSPLPSESILAGEECDSQNFGKHIETSATDTSKLSEENSSPTAVECERDHNIPIQDDASFSNKIFDGNSEHCAESTDVPQSLDLSDRIVDGNSENVRLSQTLTSGTGPFDENSEQFVKNVDMSQSLNVVFSPSAEIKSVVASGDNCLSPKESDSEMISLEDSAGVIPSAKDLEPSAIHTKANVPGEYFVAAAVTDSEDSSLDSNLSQIMNVNIEHTVTTSVEKGALNWSSSDIATELPSKISDLSTSSMPSQKLPPYINDNIPTTNGHQSCMVGSFSYGNGVDDCKTSSITEDHHTVSSLINNEINSNVVSSINNRNVQNILNSGDINFNKVPSNPFLTTDETSEVSESQFLNQEDIMRNPFQTESHA